MSSILNKYLISFILHIFIYNNKNWIIYNKKSWFFISNRSIACKNKNFVSNSRINVSFACNAIIEIQITYENRSFLASDFYLF